VHCWNLPRRKDFSLLWQPSACIALSCSHKEGARHKGPHTSLPPHRTFSSSYRPHNNMPSIALCIHGTSIWYATGAPYLKLNSISLHDLFTLREGTANFPPPSFPTQLGLPPVELAGKLSNQPHLLRYYHNPLVITASSTDSVDMDFALSIDEVRKECFYINIGRLPIAMIWCRAAETSPGYLTHYSRNN
jgi:hypothetical protein